MASIVCVGHLSSVRTATLGEVKSVTNTAHQWPSQFCPHRVSGSSLFLIGSSILKKVVVAIPSQRLYPRTISSLVWIWTGVSMPGDGHHCSLCLHTPQGVKCQLHPMGQRDHHAQWEWLCSLYQRYGTALTSKIFPTTTSSYHVHVKYTVIVRAFGN